MERYTPEVRNVPPFSCPACGTTSPKQQRCGRCGGPVVDANGVEALSPVQVRPNAFGVVGTLGSWFGDRTSRKRVEQLCEESGQLRAIADTPDGVVRVRGRVRILRPVRAPDGMLVAAYRVRRLVDARESSPPPSVAGAERPRRRWIEDGSSCGAFLLDDGSGLALVDDDAFDIEALDVAPIPASGDGMLALAEGDLADVIGPARWGAPPAEFAGSPRLGGDPVVLFEGRPDERLIILPLPLTAVMPIPRSKWVQPSAPRGPSTREHEALSELEGLARAEAESRGRNTRSD
jgi:hypothetical protein